MTFPFTLKLFSLNTVSEMGRVFILVRGSYPQISLFEAAIIPGVGLRGGEEAAVRTDDGVLGPSHKQDACVARQTPNHRPRGTAPLATPARAAVPPRRPAGTEGRPSRTPKVAAFGMRRTGKEQKPVHGEEPHPGRV